MIEYFKKIYFISFQPIPTNPSCPCNSMPVCVCVCEWLWWLVLLFRFPILFPSMLALTVFPLGSDPCVVALCLCASCHRGFSRFSFYFPSHHSTVRWFVCVCVSFTWDLIPPSPSAFDTRCVGFTLYALLLELLLLFFFSLC